MSGNEAKNNSFHTLLNSVILISKASILLYLISFFYLKKFIVIME